VAGALVAGALALGLLAGASIAPAPPSSLASDSNVLTRLLALLASQGSGSRSTAAPVAPSAAAAPVPAASTPAAKPAASATLPATPNAKAPGEGSLSESSAPSGSEEGAGEKKPVRLPPISHVWLVVLDGAGFAQATATPAGYPYLTGQLLKDGMLLERYSAIEAYELAGDVALLTGGIGESVSTISQQCGPAAGGTQASASQPSGTTELQAGSVTTSTCASDSPAGEQAEADAFLQRAVTPILSSSAYRERDLIVITFGSAAQEQDPPALSLTTLGASPPGGALLLSPTLKAGGHSSETFNSLAPRKSLEAIFAGS
jgi:hypothetical protein